MELNLIWLNARQLLSLILYLPSPHLLHSDERKGKSHEKVFFLQSRFCSVGNSVVRYDVRCHQICSKTILIISKIVHEFVARYTRLVGSMLHSWNILKIKNALLSKLLVAFFLFYKAHFYKYFVKRLPHCIFKGNMRKLCICTFARMCARTCFWTSAVR